MWGEEDSNLRSRKTTDLQSAPFGRSGISPYNGSRWTDSNRRPADYKSAALPTELHRPEIKNYKELHVVVLKKTVLFLKKGLQKYYCIFNYQNFFDELVKKIISCVVSPCV
jgi:hypothetical protein